MVVRATLYKIVICLTYFNCVLAADFEVCKNVSSQALEMGCNNCEGRTCMYKLSCCSLDRLDTVLAVDPHVQYQLDAEGCFRTGDHSFCMERVCLWRRRLQTGQFSPAFSMNTLGRAKTSNACGNLLMIVSFHAEVSVSEEDVVTQSSAASTTAARKPPSSHEGRELLIPLGIGVGVVVLACIAAVIFFIVRIHRQSVLRQQHKERASKAKRNLIWYIENNKAVKNCVGEKPQLETKIRVPLSVTPEAYKPASVHSHNSPSRASSESLLFNCRKTLTALPSIYEQSVSVASGSSRGSSSRSLLPAPSVCMSDTLQSVTSVGDSYQSVNSLGSALTRHSLLLSQRNEGKR